LGIEAEVTIIYTTKACQTPTSVTVADTPATAYKYVSGADTTEYTLPKMTIEPSGCRANMTYQIVFVAPFDSNNAVDALSTDMDVPKFSITKFSGNDAPAADGMIKTYEHKFQIVTSVSGAITDEAKAGKFTIYFEDPECDTT